MDLTTIPTNFGPDNIYEPWVVTESDTTQEEKGIELLQQNNLL